MGRTGITWAALLSVAILASAAPSEGRLTLVDEERHGVAAVDGLLGARGVAISPDGLNVYAVGVVGDSLAAFARNSATGALTFLEAHRDGVNGVDGLDGPLQLAVSPDGAFVYVVSGNDDAIAVFRRDAATGKLSFTTAYTGVGAAQGAAQPVSSIAISPDGRNVYAGAEGAVLIAFDRDATSGGLTVRDVETDGVGGVTAMRALPSLGFTPDGSRLYGIGFRTFVTFERDSLGALTFLGQATVGLSDFFSTGAVTVFVNGADVYATADVHFGPDHAFGAIGLLRAGITPGALTLVQQENVGTGITEPRAIAASGNGAFVFVGSLGDDDITAFRRAPDGRLTFSERRDAPLSDVFSIVVSPDSRHLYAVGANSNNLVAFRISPDPVAMEVPALSTTGVVVMLAAFATVLWWQRQRLPRL